MIDRLVFMKVKVKSLAEEARIIRREEKKALAGSHWERWDKEAFVRRPCARGTEGSYSPLYQHLHEHRGGTLRGCARLNLLAYGFLRGKPYSQMEVYCERLPDWKKVKKFARAFCPDKTYKQPWPDEWEARWQAWLGSAEAWLKVGKEARERVAALDEEAA